MPGDPRIAACQGKGQRIPFHAARPGFQAVPYRVGAGVVIVELARSANRNIQNVSEDVRYLAQVGLVDLQEGEKKVSARVNYDKILLEIAV